MNPLYFHMLMIHATVQPYHIDWFVQFLILDLIQPIMNSNIASRLNAWSILSAALHCWTFCIKYGLISALHTLIQSRCCTNWGTSSSSAIAIISNRQYIGVGPVHGRNRGDNIEMEYC